jgi:hypothetical protein
MKTLEYYFVRKGVIEHVIFNKYTIDENGVIRNENTGKQVTCFKNMAGYNRCGVYDGGGNKRKISVGRALVSTFCGQPSSPQHTADHIDRNPTNDTIENIRWLCKPGQRENRTQPKTFKSAFIVIKDGEEKTIGEWVAYLKKEKNRFGREYNTNIISHYAQRKQYGFSYKEYPDLPGEIWLEIPGQTLKQRYWLISNMCRVKYITKYAENVLSGDRLALEKGYPRFVLGYCHVIAFLTFFPDKWATKKLGEIVLHEEDDKLDFRPHKLLLGTYRENAIQAYANGCYDGTKSAMMSCASYIDGVFEKEHESQNDAARYLKLLGYDKAHQRDISAALLASRDGKLKIRHDRTWRII